MVIEHEKSSAYQTGLGAVCKIGFVACVRGLICQICNSFVH